MTRPNAFTSDIYLLGAVRELRDECCSELKPWLISLPFLAECIPFQLRSFPAIAVFGRIEERVRVTSSSSCCLCAKVRRCAPDPISPKGHINTQEVGIARALG